MGSWDGNYSRHMFLPENQYVRNLTQQKKPVPDADLNESREQLYEYFRNFIKEYFGDSLFLGDAWLCAGVSEANSIDLNAGYAYLEGHQAYGHALVKYVNDGADKTKKNIYSVSTGLTATILTDSAMNWAVNELVGRTLVPDVTDGTSFPIVSNTATTITVTGDMTAVAAVGNSYRVNTSTPSGGPRTDTVWLNLYLDEIDATEDTNLIHAIGAGYECERRLKARTIISIEQGTSAYSSYTDVDGNYHVLIKLATIARSDGVATITSGDVTDERSRIFGSGLGGDGQKVKVSSDDTEAYWLDGKVAAGVGIALNTIAGAHGEALEISAPGSTTDEKVKTQVTDTTPGYLVDKIVGGDNITVAVDEPTPGNFVIEITGESGDTVLADSTDKTPGTLYGGVPKLEQGSGIALSVVEHGVPGNENRRVRITNTGAVGGGGGTALYEEHVAIAKQFPSTPLNSRFTLANSYSPGTHSLMCEINGATVAHSFLSEVDSTHVQVSGGWPGLDVNGELEEGTKVVFYVARGDDKVACSLDDPVRSFLEDKILAGPNISITTEGVGVDEYLQITATGGGLTASMYAEVQATSNGQSIFSVAPQSYEPGIDALRVYINGHRLRKTLFTETDSQTVTLHSSVAAGITIGDMLIFEVPKGQSETGFTAHLYEPQTVSFDGQVTFNLATGTYEPGTNTLKVWLNGVRLLVGLHYTETDEDTITINGAAISTVAGQVILFEVPRGSAGDLLGRLTKLATPVQLAKVEYTTAGNDLTDSDAGYDLTPHLPAGVFPTAVLVHAKVGFWQFGLGDQSTVMVRAFAPSDSAGLPSVTPAGCMDTDPRLLACACMNINSATAEVTVFDTNSAVVAVEDVGGNPCIAWNLRAYQTGGSGGVTAPRGMAVLQLLGYYS